MLVYIKKSITFALPFDGDKKQEKNVCLKMAEKFIDILIFSSIAK